MTFSPQEPVIPHLFEYDDHGVERCGCSRMDAEDAKVPTECATARPAERLLLEQEARLQARIRSIEVADRRRELARLRDAGEAAVLRQNLASVQAALGQLSPAEQAA